MRIRKQWSPRLLFVPPDLLSSTPHPPSPPPSPPPNVRHLASSHPRDHQSSAAATDQSLCPVMLSRNNDPTFSNRRFQQDPKTRSGEQTSISEEKWWFSATNQSFGEDTSAASSVSSSFSHDEGIRLWCEEEKAFPLKKRRLTLVRAAGEKEEEVMKGITEKSEGNQKWVQLAEENEEDDEDDEVDSAKSMDFLRYSRSNNGCGEKRASAYSMCKHDVENSRKRNRIGTMPCVNNDPSDESITDPKKMIESCKCCCGIDDSQEELRAARKRRKINGVLVKARSMNSLLRQTVPLVE